MKTIIKILFLLLILSGCEKEPLLPPCNPTQYTNDTTHIKTHLLDGKWKVMSGTIYMENLDTGEEEEIFIFSNAIFTGTTIYFFAYCYRTNNTFYFTSHFRYILICSII